MMWVHAPLSSERGTARRLLWQEHDLALLQQESRCSRLARSLLRACEADLANLLREIQQRLDVPIQGVISDGQHSIRKAVRSVLSDIFRDVEELLAQRGIVVTYETVR